MATQPRKQVKRKRKRQSAFSAFDDNESMTESRESGENESYSEMSATPPEVSHWTRMAPIAYNPFKATLKAARRGSSKHHQPVFKLEPDDADEEYYHFDYDTSPAQNSTIVYSSNDVEMVMV